MKGSTDLEYAKVVAQYIGSNHTEIIFTEEEGIEAIEEVIKVTEKDIKLIYFLMKNKHTIPF
jgi:asparagine synthetase B (glutamine-hydrolysing)